MHILSTLFLILFQTSHVFYTYRKKLVGTGMCQLRNIYTFGFHIYLFFHEQYAGAQGILFFQMKKKKTDHERINY